MPLVDLSLDWKSIRTKAVFGAWGVLAATVYGYWDHIEQFARLHTDFYASEEQTQENVAQITGQLNELADLTRQSLAYQRKTFRVIGVGEVGDFGASEAFIRINLGSSAHIFGDEREVLVTVSTDSGRVTQPMMVGGFITSNRPYIIQFSQLAADQLGVSGDHIETKLEPRE